MIHKQQQHQKYDQIIKRTELIFSKPCRLLCLNFQENKNSLIWLLYLLSYILLLCRGNYIFILLSWIFRFSCSMEVKQNKNRSRNTFITNSILCETYFFFSTTFLVVFFLFIRFFLSFLFDFGLHNLPLVVTYIFQKKCLLYFVKLERIRRIFFKIFLHSKNIFFLIY